MSKLLLSLHGFHSSPNSLKARLMSDYLMSEHPEIHFECPQLPAFPKDMWQVIESIFQQYKGYEIGVMGSSLGGFLATKIAQQYGVKVVLINPAVSPDLLLTKYQGKQTHPYLLQEYEIEQDYINQLKMLQVESLSRPELAWVLLQEGDEVLDYHEALHKYQDSKVTCEKGGDHSFIGFERYLAELVQFLY